MGLDLLQDPVEFGQPGAPDGFGGRMGGRIGGCRSARRLGCRLRSNGGHGFGADEVWPIPDGGGRVAAAVLSTLNRCVVSIAPRRQSILLEVSTKVLNGKIRAGRKKCALCVARKPKPRT